MSGVTVKLFYADWCGHCQTFKGEWAKLKKMAGGRNIKTEEYEASNEKVMTENNIQGYPTIKIFKGGKADEYVGQRSADAILDHIDKFVLVKDSAKNGGSSCNDPNANQCGGGRRPKQTPRMSQDDYYKMKYLKYKAKYMDLLSKQ